MKKSENIKELEYLAASQWGMFTTAQAQGLGVRRNQISRMVDAFKVEPICYGVYRFVAGADAAQSELKAVWLSTFPEDTACDRLSFKPYDAVLAGRTAAFALGAGDFHASPYTFIVNRRKQTSRGDIRFLQCKLDNADVVLVDGIPSTSFERTVFDLLRLDEDPGLVDGFIRDAARKCGHVFDLERLAALLSGLASRYGFSAGDGMAFASDLVARNAAVYQVERASDAIAKAFDAVYGQGAISSVQEQIKRMIATIVSTWPLERYRETMFSAQKALEASPGFFELQQTMSRLSAINMDMYPGLAKALDSFKSIRIPQVCDQGLLTSQIFAAALEQIDERDTLKIGDVDE